MDARERQAIIRALVPRGGSQLESFFRSHGLANAYRRNQGAGKEQKINDALAGAEVMGSDPDELLRDAVTYFGLGDESPSEPQRIVAPAPDSAFPTFARLERLHPRIKKAAGRLFRDGHSGAAILEAFKAVEVRVKEMSGLGRHGKDLMAHAFRGQPPPVQINAGQTQSDADEQEGFQLIFMGSIQGIRNPKAHDLFSPIDDDRAFEYLAFASLLMRRLDDAE